MTDVVVTVPKAIWWGWILEGDGPGDPPTGEEWGFSTWGLHPDIAPGERVYVVAHGRLRGYAPLTQCVFNPNGFGKLGQVVLGRKGGAVAVTIARPIRGFRGWRYRDWDRCHEIPYPDWKTDGVDTKPKGAPHGPV